MKCVHRSHLSVVFFVFFTVFFLLPSTSLAVCKAENYEATPPFLTTTVKPDVMFMLDNSGSMKVPLYNSGWKCNSTGTDYNNSTSYYGLFDETKNYTYNATVPVDPTPWAGTPYNVTVDTTQTGAFVEDSCTPGGGANCWSGNFLNWMATRRIDGARKVLVGGRVESRSGYDYLSGDSGDLEWKIIGNNERSDYSICKSDASGASYSPFPDNTVFTVSSPANNGTVKSSYQPYATIAPGSGGGLIYNSAGTVIGEAGTVTVSADTGSGDWNTVTLAGSYGSAPIVVAGPLSYDGSDPSSFRIKSVTATSFKIRLEEWEYRDGAHTNETIFYMVLTSGAHTLTGGGNMYAGSVSTDHNWTTVTHNQGLSDPVVMAAVVTNNGGDTVTTRLKDINSNRIKVKVQEEEANGSHTNETVDYIIVEAGSHDAGQSAVLEADTVNNVDENWDTINFTTSGSPLYFLAHMQTTDDNDPATLRYRNLGSSSVEVKVEEEKSANNETNHGNEKVGYFVYKPGSIFNIALVVETEPTGLVHDFADKMNMGASFYRIQQDSDMYNSEWAHGGTMRQAIPYNPFVKNAAATTFRNLDTPVKSTTSTLVDAIEHTPLEWGTTPLAENYFEVIRYFKQDTPYYDDKPTIGTTTTYLVYDDTDNDPSSLWDPYYSDATGERVRCVKGYVIILTDGEPYRDDYVPDNLAGYDIADYDGDSHSGDCFHTGNTSNSCKNNLDDLAKWAYWNSTTGTNRDLRSDLDGEQFLSTYTIAFGSSSIPTILQDTADNGGGTAYSAATGEQLKTALSSAITDILKKTAAGSSISVLSEKATSGAVIQQAIFAPEKTYGSYTIEWPGFLHGYWFYNSGGIQNIREDNTNSFFLDTLADNIVVFNINSSGSLEIPYYTPDATGDLDVANLVGTYSSIDDVHTIWESGDMLKDRAGSDRTIYGIDESGSLRLFANEIVSGDNNYTNFDDLFGNAATYPACLGANATDRAKNLISYIRGEADDFSAHTGSACRNRVVDALGSIWKLADIIHSTPKVVDYTGYSLLFTGSNDGMLHAFKVGKVRKDGLSAGQAFRLCDANTGGCTTSEIGKEQWAIIPKHAMAYLKYQADTDFCHIYCVDLPPYYINDGDQKIIIAGMRFGGATGGTYHTAAHGGSDYWIGDQDRDGVIDTDSDGDQVQVIPETTATCTAAHPENCVGLSSYFAIDVTDPDNPVFLWEYSHPDLGFSYSGPAWIKRNGKQYVMFASGPVTYKGGADNQELRLFIVQVDSDFHMVDPDADGNVDEHVYKIAGSSGTDFDGSSIASDSTLNPFNEAFGGRMFTNGVDADGDGYTDAVFFGVNWQTGGQWKGNVLAVVPNDSDPATGSTVNWDIEKVFNQGQEPITSKIEYGQCFGNPYIYFGTGRWFYKLDEPGSNATDINNLYAIGMADCMNAITDGDSSTSCNMNFNNAHANRIEDCGTVDGTGDNAWQFNGMEPKSGDYLKERVISDPSFLDDENIITFTTTQPSSDVCDFGGRTRVFAFNCISGHSIFTGCTGYVPPQNSTTGLLLQLSGGNIEQFGLDQNSFSQAGNKATPWMTGIPPESGVTPVPESPLLSGNVILWIER